MNDEQLPDPDPQPTPQSQRDRRILLIATGIMVAVPLLLGTLRLIGWI